MSNKVIVIGAGAAGTMAAGFAANNGADVLLIERNEKIARKVMITGKGRCNVTNAVSDVQEFISNIPGNGRFLFGAFSAFNSNDTMEFFEKFGVELKVERGNRVFPVSDKAVDIVDALNRFITKSGVKRKTERVTNLIVDDNKIVGVKTDLDNEYYADSVIIATGGLSYPKTGSSGDGYKLAEAVGHTVTTLRPSLSALVCREGLCSECMGLSLKNVKLTVVRNDSGKAVFEDFGEMMFTHFGLTGPLVLSASAHLRDMKKDTYTACIDLKPALDEKTLDARLISELQRYNNKDFINSLGGLLPQKMIETVVKMSGIDPRKKCNSVTKEERAALLDVLKHFKMLCACLKVVFGLHKVVYAIACCC
jgi:predicted Rossmann fold flavoprotein